MRLRCSVIHELFMCTSYLLLLILYRYVRKGSLYTKRYLFLICNSLIFFFSLPIIEIFVTMIKNTNDNDTSTKHFPFIALYPKNYYNFPIYEVRVSFFFSLCVRVLFFTKLLIIFCLHRLFIFRKW